LVIASSERFKTVDLVDIAIEGFQMVVKGPEAGLPIDKDLILVVAFHEELVRKHGAKPITLKFLLDSQRSDGVDGHYEAEYEMGDGRPLKLRYKRIKNEMAIKVETGRAQLSYSINIDRCINEDLVHTPTLEFDDLVAHWVAD
jgi:hypothetical protein